MTDEVIEVTGLTCPAPLVETRKKLNKMQVGDVLEIIGDHGPSKKEVPEAMEELGHTILSVTEKNGVWYVKIKKMN